MIGPSTLHSGQDSGNTAELHEVFLKRVHQLLGLGYDRMDTPAYCADDEPAITGDLVKAMEEVLDDPDAEPWVTFYHVHDDKPVHDRRRRHPRRAARRTGKRRRRVDIRIDSSEQRPRNRLSFEAKRLDERHLVGGYLGDDGLGRFLIGEYARDDDEAGMLGYVQSGSPVDWGDKIAAALCQSPRKYALRSGSPWRESPLVPCLNYTYRSGHERQGLARGIEIYHTLLRFC